MAIHVTQGSGPPTAPPPQLGMHYVDTTAKQHYLSVGTGAASDWVLVGAGASTFLQLTDTPSSYQNQAGKFAQVNPATTGLIFSDTTFIGDADTPNSYGGQAGKVVAVRPDETGLQFITPSGGGGGITAIPENHKVYVDTVYGSDQAQTNRGQIQLPFKTVTAACAYVETLNPGPGNDWAIVVQGGVYQEQNPIQLPNYTGLYSSELLRAIIVPINQSLPLIDAGMLTNISGLQLQAPLNNAAVKYLPAIASTLTDCLIWGADVGGGVNDVGIDVALSNTSDTDLFIDRVNIGQLGRIKNCVKITGAGSSVINNLYTSSPNSDVVHISGGARVKMSLGRILFGARAFVVEGGSNLLISDFACQDVARCVDILDANNNVVINSTVFSAIGIAPGSGSACIVSAGDNNNIECNACQFRFYDRGLAVADDSVLRVNGCRFWINDTANALAILASGESEANITSCLFECSSNANGPRACFADMESFINARDCIFLNFRLMIECIDSAGIDAIDCGFEFTDYDDPGLWQGTVAGIARGNSYLYCNSTYCYAETGFSGFGTSTLELELIDLGGAIVEFVQNDQCTVHLTQGSINEDKIQVEDWSYVTGNYKSTKAGDTGLVVIDQLKVGVPESGSRSSQGEGASYTRGMLVYGYNPATDTYTDISEECRNEGGPPVGMPNTIPDSAVYIASSLIGSDGLPTKFNATWNDFDTVPVMGSGTILVEIFSIVGAWVPVKAFITEASKPYRHRKMVDLQDGVPYNFRFSEKLYTQWALSDPVGYGQPLFWLRYRVASDWFNDAWQYRLPLDVPPASVAGVQTNFVLYFNLALITDMTFWNNVKVDGSDIRVTDASGTNLLSMELTAFNKTGKTGTIWFKSPTVTNTLTDHFFVYFGNAAATPVLPTDQNGAYNVWLEYVAVYHLNSSGPPWVDSSVNQNTLFVNGVISSVPSAKFNGGASTNGNTASGLTCPNKTDFSPGSLYTVEAWGQLTTAGGTRKLLSWSNSNAGSNDYFGIMVNNAGIPSFAYNAANSLAVASIAGGAYAHLLQTISTAAGTAQSMRGYVNGARVITAAATTPVTVSTRTFGIGNTAALNQNQAWPSAQGFDEVRFSRVFRDDNFVLTQYRNMNSPQTFFVVGTIQPQSEVASASAAGPIAAAPLWSQMKLWPNCSVINEDGFQEFFGMARPLILGRGLLPLFDYSTGTDNAGAGGDVFLTKSFAVKSPHRFADGSLVRMSAAFIFGNDADGSTAMRLRWHFIPRAGTPGDIYWRVQVVATDNTAQTYDTVALAPDNPSYVIETMYISTVAAAGDVNKILEAVMAIDFPVKGLGVGYNTDSDVIWINIERMGNSSLDTFSGAVDLLTIDMYRLQWRMGQFVNSFEI